MVSRGGAVLVSLDLFDREFVIDYFSGSRNGAGGYRMVVFVEPANHLARLCGAGRLVFLYSEVFRASVAQSLPGAFCFLDFVADRWVDRDSEHGAGTRVDPRAQHSGHHVNGRALDRGGDEPL